MNRKNYFIPLSGESGKIAFTSWKLDENQYAPEHLEVKYPDKGIGFVPPEGYIVVDTDSVEATKRVELLLSSLKLKVFSYATTKGRHYLFKNRSESRFANIKSQVNTSIFNTKDKPSKIDLKANGGGYVMITNRTTPETILKEMPLAPTIPLMLLLNIDAIDLDEYTEGQRDEVVFKKWIVPFKQAKWDKELFVEIMIEIAAFKGDKESIQTTVGWAKQKWESSDKRGTVTAKKGDKDDKEILTDDIVIDYFNMISYNDDVFIKNPKTNIWENTSMYGKNEKQNTARINYVFKKASQYGTYEIDKTFSSARVIAKVQTEKAIQKRFDGIVFTNGYVDEDGFHKTKDIPFSIAQIPHAYNPNVKPNPIIIKYLSGLSKKNKGVVKDLLAIWGTALSSKNFEIFPILYGEEGQEGKSTFFKIMIAYLGRQLGTTVRSSAVMGRSSYTFALRNIKNKTFVALDELPNSFQKHERDMIKVITNTGTLDYDAKNSNEAIIDSTPTWLATSNHIPKFDTVDKAFITRLAFYEVGVSPLTDEEWGELHSNYIEMLESIMPAIIKQYVRVLKGKKSRNQIFEHNQLNLVVKQNIIEDDVYQWIEEHESFIIGSKAIDVYGYYEAERQQENLLPKVGKNTLSSKILAMGFKWKKTNKTQVYMKKEEQDVQTD